jgi:hypothetical protein
MLFRLVRDPGTLSGSRFIWPYFFGPGTGPEGARAPHPFQSRQPRAFRAASRKRFDCSGYAQARSPE